MKNKEITIFTKGVNDKDHFPTFTTRDIEEANKIVELYKITGFETENTIKKQVSDDAEYWFIK